MANKSKNESESGSGLMEKAESVYAKYQASLEGGDSWEEKARFNLEELCAEHRPLASALRKIHGELECVAQADRRHGLIPRGDSLEENSALDVLDVVGAKDGGVGASGEEMVHEVLERLQKEAPKDWPYENPVELGRGGFGIVYRINEGVLRRDVALKTLRNWTQDGSNAKREKRRQARHTLRFLAEAQILAQLDHPSIVPLYRLGVDSSGKPYFTMRLVRGRDLTQVVKLIHHNREGWDVNRGLEVLLKVCDAVSYVHSKRVLHRDLKPDNIRVGRFGEVYVMDWGLARVVDDKKSPSSVSIVEGLSDSIRTFKDSLEGEEGSGTKLTLDGTVIGSPAFMSPEQARGEQSLVDSRSDIYSLGAVLYNILTGQAPYTPPEGESGPRQIVQQVSMRPPTPLLELKPNLAPELEAICAKAMSRDPDGRYQTVGRLAADLRAFLDGRVVLAYGSGRFLELTKWVARNRTLAWSSLSAALLLLVGLTATAVLLTLKNNEISASEARLLANNRFFDSAFLDTVLFNIGVTRDHVKSRGAQTSVVESFENARLSGLAEDLGGDLPLRMSISMGNGRLGMGELIAAESEFKGALQLLQELDDPDPKHELHIRLGFLWVDAFDQRFESGRARALEVLAITPEVCYERVSAYMALAILEHNAGRLHEGLRRIDAALSLADEINRAADVAPTGPDHKPPMRINTAILNGQRANLLTRVGIFEGKPSLEAEADHLASGIVSGASSSGVPVGGFEQGLARLMLARLALKRGEPEEAGRHSELALTVLLEFSGKDSTHTLKFESVWADIAIMRGGKLGGAEGEQLVSDGFRVHEELVRRARRLLNSSRNSVALRVQGRYAMALAISEDADRFERARGAFEFWQELLEQGQPDQGIEHFRVLNAWAYYLLQPGVTDYAITRSDLGRAARVILDAKELGAMLLRLEAETPVGEAPLYAWHPGEVTLLELALAHTEGNELRVTELLAELEQSDQTRPSVDLEMRKTQLFQQLGLD